MFIPINLHVTPVNRPVNCRGFNGLIAQLNRLRRRTARKPTFARALGRVLSRAPTLPLTRILATLPAAARSSPRPSTSCASLCCSLCVGVLTRSAASNVKEKEKGVDRDGARARYVPLLLSLLPHVLTLMPVFVQITREPSSAQRRARHLHQTELLRPPQRRPRGRPPRGLHHLRLLSTTGPSSAATTEGRRSPASGTLVRTPPHAMYAG